MTDSYGATHVQALEPDIGNYVPGHDGLSSVSPVISEPAARVWRMTFIHAAESDEVIDWQGAGLALCVPGDVERVSVRLGELVEETNAQFPAALENVSDSEMPYAMDRGDAVYSEDGKHFRIDAS